MFRQKTFTISFLAVVLCMGTVHGAVAQDFKRQYKNAKDFFMEGKYNLAMEAFKPLISYDKNNPYSEYASFYYAQSAYRQRFFAVAKDMLLSIKKLYPEWDQMNEVNYWLAKIYFEQREYFQGMHMLQQVRQEDFIEVQEIGKIKRFYLSQIADPEVLRMMWEEYPQDAEVGTRLATAISRQPFLQQDRALLDAVISHFGLPRDQFSAASQAQLVFKDKYNVAVVFPFLTSTLDPSPAKKQNQLVLDLYEGMRMAADTLNKTGVPINLLAYDTERNPEALKKLLEADELKNADLIVGPIFREEFKPVQQISESRQINMISPVSNNSEFTGQNPFALLFQPSLETLGSKSADMLAKHTRNKKCMVLYGDTPKDSIMAANFIKQAGTVGLNVVWSEEFRKETAARIISILATPTEFDEYKNPIQFKMKIDSIGSIFVASDNPLIYTKVISSVETRGDSV
ncbi:MAG: ABC transporter substrate-binding protein, partial [Cyclobacteriaceae bacterium]|nr:ABC transporter substrate-binding protein [Cyclobacteriaceae bacterium]